MFTARQSDGTTDSAAAVVAHVRHLIDRGTLGPGARLPAERDLARQVGVSRPTVRAGLRTLAALGVVRSRRGSGTYIPDGPPTLGAEALSFLAALHKFTVDDVYEARRILEVGAAGLAAASGNPIVASLVEMVAALYYERRRTTAERAVDRDLRDAAEAHRQIYQAIRARDAERAKRLMHEHLVRARSYQAKEVLASTFKVQSAPKRRAARRCRRCSTSPAAPPWSSAA